MPGMPGQDEETNETINEAQPAGLTIDLTARVGDQVFRALRTAILNGQFPEGYRLRIRDLVVDEEDPFPHGFLLAGEDVGG